MLQSVQLVKLRIKEFIQFFTDFISILVRNNPEELEIKEQLDDVVKELEKIKAIHGTDKSSEISDELKEIDDRRDDDITGIRMAAEAYTHHYETNIKEAAELILNTIDQFGSSIARQNYPTETASLNGIAEKFNTLEECKKALSLLKLTAWAQKMDKENQFFNQRYLDRLDEKAKQSEEKIKELRKTTTENYFKLRNRLNAHAELNNTKYQSVIDKLNKLIEEYNGIVNRRKGGKNTEDNKIED